jgi:hypothetical protein
LTPSGTFAATKRKAFNMEMRIIVVGALIVLLLPMVSRARDYSANIGRFMTMDTFEGDQEDPQSLHKYVYCANNPVNLTDPNGENYYFGGSTAGHGHFWLAVDIGNGQVLKYDYGRKGFTPAKGSSGWAKDAWYAKSGPGQATATPKNSIKDAVGPNEYYMFLESVADDLAMAQRVIDSTNNPPDYNLITHNCGHQSFAIAQHGWPALAPMSPRPAAFLQVVRDQWQIRNMVHLSMNTYVNSIPFTVEMSLPLP